MNREEKAQLLSELAELFNGSEIVVVSHYKGLTVKEVSELRDNSANSLSSCAFSSRFTYLSPN